MPSPHKEMASSMLFLFVYLEYVKSEEHHQTVH